MYIQHFTLTFLW